MNYIAGLFDAEGYVTLSQKGAFHVATEMANERIPQILCETFKGSIYIRHRDKRRKTWAWKSTNTDQVIHFINEILPFSIIKKQQLLLLKQYLSHNREDRARFRKEFISCISECKKPRKISFRFVQVPTTISPETIFFEWFAGFIDGDGNFTLYESKKQFQTQLSVSNIIPDVIKYVKDRVDGSITISERSKNPIWKWVCKKSALISTCESILPFLRVKRDQCQVIIDYEKSRKPWSESQEYRDEVRSMISKIKHLNSL